MTIRHHPDDATLLAYAAGTVTQGFALVIAAHAELCHRCRKRVDEAEHVGGSLLDALEESPLAEHAFEALWMRIAENRKADADSQQRRSGASGIPSVLAPWLGEGFSRLRWRILMPGVRQHRLAGFDNGGGTVRLLSIAPGTTIPHHGHGGSELTLVLRGSYVDEIGRFRAGDLADLDSDVLHQPVADTDETCICLIATDAPLRFSGMLGRMVQPLVGI